MPGFRQRQPRTKKWKCRRGGCMSAGFRGSSRRRLFLDQPKVMFGMLVIILGFDCIPGCRRGTGHRYVAIELCLWICRTIGAGSFDPGSLCVRVVRRCYCSRSTAPERGSFIGRIKFLQCHVLWLPLNDFVKGLRLARMAIVTFEVRFIGPCSVCTAAPQRQLNIAARNKSAISHGAMS